MVILVIPSFKNTDNRSVFQVFFYNKKTQKRERRSVDSGLTWNLQTHLKHIRVALLETQRFVERIGLVARGGRGEVKVDGREFGAGEVDDALQEGAVDPLPPVGRRDHDILDTRLPPRRRFIDTEGGASDNLLGIVLRGEDPRSRRRHRTPLHLRSDCQLGIQFLHKSQQIIDLGVRQGAKFKISHSIWKVVFVRYLINGQTIRPRSA